MDNNNNTNQNNNPAESYTNQQGYSQNADVNQQQYYQQYGQQNQQYGQQNQQYYQQYAQQNQQYYQQYGQQNQQYYQQYDQQNQQYYQQYGQQNQQYTQQNQQYAQQNQQYTQQNQQYAQQNNQQGNQQGYVSKEYQPVTPEQLVSGTGNNNGNNNPEKKKSKAGIIIAIVAVAAVLFLGGIGAVLFFVLKKSPKKDNTTEIIEIDDTTEQGITSDSWREWYEAWCEEGYDTIVDENNTEVPDNPGTDFTYVSKVFAEDTELQKQGIVPCKVTVTGAELFRYKGREAIRVYYDFESHWYDFGDFPYMTTCPANEIEVRAFQGGLLLYKPYELDNLTFEYDGSSEAMDNTPTEDNHVSENDYANNIRAFVRPGHAVRCAAEFLCDWDRGDITFEISHKMYHAQMNYYDPDDPDLEWMKNLTDLTIDFNPDNLPARYASETDWIIEDKDPTWTKELPEEGIVQRDYDKYANIKINDAEFKDVDGEKHIFVNFTYTHLGEESESIADTTFVGRTFNTGWPSIWVIQDGASLKWVCDDETTELLNKKLSKDESVDLTLEYVVRTDSPVEVEINCPQNGGFIAGYKSAGKVFTVE